MNTVSFSLPIPDSKLTPNSRVKPQYNASRIRKHRELACTVAMQQAPSVPFHMASLTRTFYFRDSRDRDLDNFAAGCKAYLDGIRDAGIIENDHCKCLVQVEAVFGGVDKENPRVDFVITEI